MKTLSEIIGERLKALREAKKLSQADLAKLIGWSSASRIGNYELGARKISADDAIILASSLGVSPAELLFGDSAHQLASQFQYPLYAKISAGGFNDVGSYTERDSVRLIPTTVKASDDAFWLIVDGHSMTAPQGAKPSFPEGMLILVDPSEVLNIKSGDFCVAGLNNDEVTFKQFSIYGGKPQLEPLNQRYDIIPFDENCKLIGKVITAQWPEETFQ
ncbi:LexA family transcriptional regulator [Serratia sp. BIGb0163]|uniref:LexA family protein n=1 Tax=unclassified Serratia (in: enterobacteria) TaxID=2647522 RepID=UPI0021670F8D|nr:S24 family peptidase [Serratia sp. BIGb0163]MCS4265130.1 SOS-response transcriptional repressor LexA [Serratia sp. BIGb0163]